MKRIAVVMALLALVAVARADTVTMKDGSHVSGKIVEVGDKSLTMELADPPGVKFGVQFDQMNDFSLYEVKSAKNPDTYDAHVALANFCEEREMFHFAVLELKKAIALDASRKESLNERIAGLQDTCGKTFYTKGESLQAAGRLTEAIKFFKDVAVRYPGCKFDAKSKEKVAELQAVLADEKKRAAAEKAHAAAAAAADEKASEDAKARERIFALVEKGKQELQAGLAAARSLTKQEDLLEAAELLLEKARKLAVKLPATPKAPPSGDTAPITKEQIVEEVTDNLIDALVALGFNAVQRGAFEKAFEFDGLALALEPNNESAVSLRATIATARAEATRNR